MYTSQQMLRVRHDEWLRYAETRRMIKHARIESRDAGAESARPSARRPLLRLGPLVRQD